MKAIIDNIEENYDVLIRRQLSFCIINKNFKYAG